MQKKKRGKPLPFWLTGREYKYSGNRLMPPWIRVDQTLMQDDVFRALSLPAQFTYLCMCLEAGEKPTGFTFSNVTAQKYHIANSTLRRTVTELCDAGFIKKRRPKGTGILENSRFEKYLPTEYSLVSDWKNQ